MRDDAVKTRIDRVVDHIQANPGSRLLVGELAEIACFWEFHFNRVFQG